MLRHTENPIAPLQTISAADMAAGPAFVTPRMWVGEYSTLHIYALPILKPTVTDNGTTVQVFVNFYQTVTGTSVVPGPNAVSPVSRQFAVGSSKVYRAAFGTPAAFDIVPSTLMANLPITAPWVEVSLYINNQANVDSCKYAMWLSNQPSQQPMGSNSFALTHPASIAGGAENGGGFGTTSGIFVGAGQVVINELLLQSVGSGYFSWVAAGFAAGVANQSVLLSNLLVKIVCLDPNSPTHLESDILHEIYSFPNNPAFSERVIPSTANPGATGFIGKLPLNGYKQALYMKNLTSGGGIQDMAIHWFATPEFS